MIPEHFFNLSLSERRSWLEANADRVAQDQTVFKDLNPNQLDELETKITEDATKLYDLDVEKKEVLADFKARRDPIKEELEHNIQSRKTGQEEITTDIYFIADYDAGRMIGFAPDGVEVINRRLQEHERQSTIHSIGRNS